MVDIYRDAKLRGIYLALDTEREGNSCFSIYQNNGIKMHFIFKETIQCKPFSIFLDISRVTGPNQSSRKRISVALVNTKTKWKTIDDRALIIFKFTAAIF